jgi:exonuclease SbcD
MKTFLGQENSEEELRAILQENWTDLAKKYCDKNGINILVSHLFVVKNGADLPEEPTDEKPILHVGGVQAVYTENIPDQIQYTALGHLHRMYCADEQTCSVYYSGSPISYSFAEANQKKYVLIIDAEPGKKVWVHEKELTKGKKLFRYRAEGMEDALQWLGNNQDCLVELTMVTETFLTAQERKQLGTAHSGIVTIIPEVKNSDEFTSKQTKSIDLTKNMNTLFRDYFKYAKGQEPNAEIMELFTEILAEENEG